MNYDLISLIVEIVSLIFVFVGGCFALKQWVTTLEYKRNDIVRPLIEDVRSNVTISTVMDIIDWNEGFYYDGKFHIDKNTSKKHLKDWTDDDLFKNIDETLSIFSYICYLKKAGSLKSADMHFFEYEIRRLFCNQHICNYLYSLYHWSKKLEVEMSFSYIVDYALKKKYVDKSFKYVGSPLYKCYLRI